MDGRILCRFWIHNLGQAVWRSSRFSCKTSAIHDNSWVPGVKKRCGWGFRCSDPHLYQRQPVLQDCKRRKTGLLRGSTIQIPSRSEIGVTNSSGINKGFVSFQLKSNVPPIMKLSSTEMKERWEKGLCYNCDEKYTTGAVAFVSFQLKSNVPPIGPLCSSHRAIVKHRNCIFLMELSQKKTTQHS